MLHGPQQPLLAFRQVLEGYQVLAWGQLGQQLRLVPRRTGNHVRGVPPAHLGGAVRVDVVLPAHDRGLFGQLVDQLRALLAVEHVVPQDRAQPAVGDEPRRGGHVAQVQRRETLPVGVVPTARAPAEGPGLVPADVDGRRPRVGVDDLIQHGGERPQRVRVRRAQLLHAPVLGQGGACRAAQGVLHVTETLDERDDLDAPPGRGGEQAPQLVLTQRLGHGDPRNGPVRELVLVLHEQGVDAQPSETLDQPVQELRAHHRALEVEVHPTHGEVGEVHQAATAGTELLVGGDRVREPTAAAGHQLHAVTVDADRVPVVPLLGRRGPAPGVRPDHHPPRRHVETQRQPCQLGDTLSALRGVRGNMDGGLRAGPELAGRGMNALGAGEDARDVHESAC